MFNPNGPSNTAVPKYYDIFREAVVRGEIPVCREVSLEMNRIDDNIDNPDIYYDPRPVEAFIRFCESELTKTDGSELKLLDSFKLWAEQLLGWHYYATKNVYIPNDNGVGGSFTDVSYLKRLISKQYLIVARGAAKSMYAAFIQAYFLVIHPETTKQITTAPTMPQADEVMAPFRTAIIRHPGPLFKFLTAPFHRSTKHGGRTASLLSSKKGIECLITGSVLEVRPMTIDKLQGLRPFVTTLDEWLSGDVREDVVGAVEQGASKLNEYIIIAITSEGTVRNGSGDDVKLELQKILSGEYVDPHTSIFHYKLDSVKEVGDPDMWLKANPNLGLTVSYESYQRDVMRAQMAPAVRNDILAKRFGLPMEGYSYFFTFEETIPHNPQSYKGMVCSMGADLSQGDDFCSFTFMFPLRNGGFGVKSINFISDRTWRALKPSARTKYEQFMREGTLIVLDGSVLNMTEVFEVLDEEIDRREYQVLCMGYDPYNAEVFVKLYSLENGEYGIERVQQGVRTESVPLGELKAMSEDRLLIFDEAIVQYAMGNTMVLQDTNGNQKLFKRRYDAKIDPVSALMDAYVAYVRNQEMFY